MQSFRTSISQMRNKLHTQLLFIFISNQRFSLFVSESALINTLPSSIAAACICSAVRGLKLASASQATRDICNLTRVDPINLELLIRFVDEQVEKVVKQANQTKQSTETTNKHSTNNAYESPTYGQPETPTEVENVYF